MRYRWTSGLIGISLLSTTLLSVHCSPKSKIEPVSEMDRPEVHYNLGMKKLESMDADEARSAFQRSIELDPKFSRGYSGLAIVSALDGDEKAAFNHLSRAKKEAKTDNDKVAFHTAAIRMETTLQGDDWLDHCKEHYQKGTKLAGNKADLTYFYGFANETAHEYEVAMEAYRRVIDMNTGRVSEADAHWKKIQQDLRAQAGSTYGEAMALKDKVTRGEMAVLLLEELDLEKHFDQPSLEVIPYDVKEHQLKNAIVKVLEWNLRGLSAAGDFFNPDRAVSRGEFAMLVEDIIIVMNGEKDLATRYIHEGESPFTDINNTSPYYNSVIVTTTKGILEPASPSVFNVNESVTGSDVLLSLRKLREYQF